MEQTVRIPPVEGQAIPSPTEVFETLLPEAADLSWAISDAEWFTGKDESLDVDSLRDEVEAAPRGLLLEWAELRRLLDDVLQVIDGTFVACRDRDAIPLRAASHEELVPSSEMVVSAVDSSYWLVSAADPVLRRLTERFPGTKPI